MRIETVKTKAKLVPVDVFIFIEEEGRFFYVDDRDVGEHETTFYFEEGSFDEDGIWEEGQVFIDNEEEVSYVTQFDIYIKHLENTIVKLCRLIGEGEYDDCAKANRKIIEKLAAMKIDELDDDIEWIFEGIIYSKDKNEFMEKEAAAMELEEQRKQFLGGVGFMKKDEKDIDLAIKE